MKAIASLVAGATLMASVASPAAAGPVNVAPTDPMFQRVSQQDWRDSCYRGENYLDCQRRLDERNRRGGAYDYNNGYQGGYGGYDRDPRYYAPGGYYDQYGRRTDGYGYNNGYGSNGGYGYNNGYGYGSNGGYYGNGYGSGGYYGNGYNNGYGSNGYGYNNGYGYGSGYNNNDQWGGVALAVIGVALGVAILGSLDDRDNWERNRNDRRYRDYCRNRYRSFDRDSGTYLGNDGYRRYCRWN